MRPASLVRIDIIPLNFRFSTAAEEMLPKRHNPFEFICAAGKTFLFAGAAKKGYDIII
jgi:hypothetical protein